MYRKYYKTESSTKEKNTFEGMNVSHLALESKTDSNWILRILLLLCLKGKACRNVFKVSEYL